MNDYWHRRWCCPYYVRSRRHEVQCEYGNRLRLPDDRAAMRYFAEFCANLSGWRRCSVACALEQHYEGK
ncbi:MAG: hypothetical protein IJT07_02665 [Oscillospiraceae bacterium]|nr:hypothetical protein [Oscillospiraceae bacterium]